ncbi:hypothetical protein DFH06DRAFT_1135316 [Mycena polygramma]|nr:hypothetical protein DFH06DRAFT_1135316 [Mycena polygramma]
MPEVHYRPRFPAAVVTGPVTPIVATAKPTVVKPTVVKPTTPLPVTKTPARTTKVIPPTTKATAPVVVPTKPTVPVTPSSVIIPPTLPLTISSTTTTSSSSVIPISTIPARNSNNSKTSKSTLASPSSAANTVAAKGTAVARVSPSVSASPSTSSVPSTSSSTSVPAVAVGIIGGLVGVVLTGVLVAFFFFLTGLLQRRWNRRSRIRDSINFDAKNFRRSAIMLESPRPPQEPDFGRGGGSIRSVPMDYHRTPPVVHQQYPYMHAPPTTYPPNTPSYPAVDYAIPANPFYSPPAYQGYPPDLNRGSFQNGSHPVAAPPPPPPAPQQQYYHDNHDDAYGGM